MSYPSGPAHHNFKHGMRGSLTYSSWRAMLSRCLNKNHKDFQRWGAKGIRVCERWLEFKNFLEDMGERPGKLFSIDRIDGTKGYFKDNCRWATTKQQCENKRKADRTSARKMDWNAVLALDSAGFSGAEIAHFFDVTPRAVFAALRKMRGKLKV